MFKAWVVNINKVIKQNCSVCELAIATNNFIVMTNLLIHKIQLECHNVLLTHKATPNCNDKCKIAWLIGLIVGQQHFMWHFHFSRFVTKTCWYQQNSVLKSGSYLVNYCIKKLLYVISFLRILSRLFGAS